MRVFVASSTERLDAAKLLRQELDGLELPTFSVMGGRLEVVVWDDADDFRPGATTIQALEDILDDYDAGIFFVDSTSRVQGLSDDDSSRIPSLNVIFELGFMAGAWGRNRTLIVHKKDHRPDMFSDFDGVTSITYDRSVTEISGRIASALATLGHRPRPHSDVGSLLRMLNICSPGQPDAKLAALEFVSSRESEAIRSAPDLVQMIPEIMSDFVTPHIPPVGGLRVYLASYIGDGIQLDESSTQLLEAIEVADDDGFGSDDYKFVLGFSNELVGQAPRDWPLPLLSEPRWRLGMPVSATKSSISDAFVG